MRESCCRFQFFSDSLASIPVTVAPPMSARPVCHPWSKQALGCQEQDSWGAADEHPQKSVQGRPNEKTDATEMCLPDSIMLDARLTPQQALMMLETPRIML